MREPVDHARYFGLNIDRGTARHSVKASEFTFNFGSGVQVGQNGGAAGSCVLADADVARGGAVAVLYLTGRKFYLLESSATRVDPAVSASLLLA